MRGTSVANEDLPRFYASHMVLLNDHWDSMRNFGYVSNRTYDVLASGGELLSDHIPSVERIFGDWVSTIGDGDDMRTAADVAVATTPDRAAASRRCGSPASGR